MCENEFKMIFQIWKLAEFDKRIRHGLFFYLFTNIYSQKITNYFERHKICTSRDTPDISPKFIHLPTEGTINQLLPNAF